MIQNFWETSIDTLNTLIERKNKEMTYLKLLKKKEANVISFKLKHYRDNVNTLEGYKTEGIEIKDISDIKKLKCSDSLKKKLTEIINNGTLQEIEKINLSIVNLEQELASGINRERSSKSSSENNPENENVPTYKKKRGRGDKRPESGNDRILFDLLRITGIGPSNAKKFLEKGISLDNLLQEWDEFIAEDENNHIIMLEKLIPTPVGTSDRRLLNKLNRDRNRLLENKFSKTKYLKHLTHHQLVGIKYFHDIEKRIPRPELQKMEQLLKFVASEINKELDITICGSYRRGQSTSGDIDMLLTHPSCKLKSDMDLLVTNPLSEFVKVLTKLGFLVDHLTSDGDTKYMGMCQLKNSPHSRRIDIRFVPYYSYGAAITYFTGSAKFNTEMRQYALKKGYSLNEYGLYKLEKDENGKMQKGEMVLTKTERELFDYLKYPYKEPTERNVK